MSETTIEVVGAIIRDGGKVLACRRAPDRSAGGLWEFPGGKIEGDETPDGALRREIREELGVNIQVGVLASRHTTPLGSKLIDLACYWAELTEPAPTASTDHDALEWVSLDDLFSREWSPADVPILHDIAPAAK